MNILIKSAVVAALFSILQTILLFNQPDSAGIFMLSEIIIHFSFGELPTEHYYIAEASLRMFPLLIFQIFFGVYIYHRFCSASVYYFSRCDNRIRWFIKESLRLYPYTVMYPFIIIGVSVMMTAIFHSVQVNSASLILLMYYLVIYSLWLFIATVLINMIAIRFGNSAFGFAIVSGLQFSFLLSLLAIDSDSTPNALLLKLNPFSHLVIKWHSSHLDSVDRLINKFGIDFDLNLSIILLFVVAIVVVVIGMTIVKKQQFISINQETEEV